MLMVFSDNSGSSVKDATEKVARRRWDALIALDDRPEIAELRGSFVPERTIYKLYEYDFNYLVPGIMRLISDKAYHHLSVADSWNERQRKIDRIVQGITTQKQDEMNADWASSFKNSSRWGDLEKHIVERLPGLSKPKRANAMISSLWIACWLMARGEPSPEKAANCFNLAADWVLPELDSHTAGT